LHKLYFYKLKNKPIHSGPIFGSDKYALFIIYKHVNVVYEKTVYERTIFVSENL